MISIIQEGQFKKDMRRMKKRGKNLKKIINLIETLSSGKKLPDKHRDHKLSGNWADFRECHIEPDWLLIYQQNKNELILTRTGSHSDLF